MDITWIGHAAFLLRSGASTLLMDPFPETLGVRVPPTLARAGVVTVSNGDLYHSATNVVSGAPVVLSGPGEYEVSGFRIKGLRTPLNANPPAEGGGWNTVFVVEVEGVVVCHLGALASPLTARQVEDLSSSQVLLLPVGGHGVLSPSDAAEVVHNIEPRIAVPMMYAHPGNRLELEPLSRFMGELGIKQPDSKDRLVVTRAALPSETQVVPLDPAATLL